MAELTARVPVRADDRPEVAVLKGDERMAEVLQRSLWGGRQAGRHSPADPRRTALPGPVERLKRYVDDLRRRGRAEEDQQVLHYAAGRERLATLLAQDARRQKEEAGGSPTDAETGRAARSPEVRASATRSGRPGRPRPRGRPWTRAGTAGPRGPRRPRQRRAGAARLTPAPVGADRPVDRRGRGAGRRGDRSARAHPGLRTRRVDEAQDLSADAVPRGRPPAGRRIAHRARRPGAGDQPVVALEWPDLSGWAGRPPSSGRWPAATGCPARCSTSPTGCSR